MDLLQSGLPAIGVVAGAVIGSWGNTRISRVASDERKVMHAETLQHEREAEQQRLRELDATEAAELARRLIAESDRLSVDLAVLRRTARSEGLFPSDHMFYVLHELGKRVRDVEFFTTATPGNTDLSVRCLGARQALVSTGNALQAHLSEWNLDDALQDLNLRGDYAAVVRELHQAIEALATYLYLVCRRARPEVGEQPRSGVVGSASPGAEGASSQP